MHKEKLSSMYFHF